MSQSGTYWAPLALRDWVYPSRPNSNRAFSTFSCSRRVMGRPSSGKESSSPQGVYWAIRLTGMPGNSWRMRSKQAMEFLVWPGRIRWRMSTPRVIRPSPS